MNIFELLQTTKTTRRNEFSDQPISEDKIDKIKSVITNTANASNRQSYSIIILDKVFEILNLPECYVFPMLAFCMGHSKNTPKPKKSRLNPKNIFHENYYQIPIKNDIEDIIIEYDKENIGLISNWKEKGYNHYLEWFFDKWSPVVGSRKENALLIKKLKEHKML